MEVDFELGYSEGYDWYFLYFSFQFYFFLMFESPKYRMYNC